MPKKRLPYCLIERLKMNYQEKCSDCEVRYVNVQIKIQNVDKIPETSQI